MNTYLTLLASIIPAIGMGHFYFSYVYHVKKEGLLKTLLLATLAIILNYCAYTLIKNIFPEYIFIVYYYIFVVFLFVIHHAYDTYRFNYKYQSILALIAGLTSVYLFFSNNHINQVATLTVWFLVIYHYMFWIYITIKKLSNEKLSRFLIEVAVVHVSFLLFYFLNRKLSISYVTLLFSLGAFHHLTSVHVIFSALKEIPLLKRIKNN